jgi:hypothetical protein
MFFHKYHDYMIWPWKLDKNTSKEFNFILIFMDTVQKRIYLHMDHNIVQKIFIFSKAEYFLD